MKIKALILFLLVSVSIFGQLQIHVDGIMLPPTSTLPVCGSSVFGKMVYQTTTQKVFICLNSTWQEVTNLNLPIVASLGSSTPLFDITNTAGGIALKGTSVNGSGVFGKSTSGVGVEGKSTNYIGGWFDGNYGGYFTGSSYALGVEGKMSLNGSTGTLGNVATINSAGNAIWQPNVAFAVKDVGVSSQTIAHNTDTQINFDSEEYDLGADFDLTTNTFTVPYTGIYHFDAAVMWDGPTNSTGILAITLRVNNTNYFTVRAPAQSSQTPSNMLSTDIKLTAGNTVKMMAFQNTGANQNINNNSITSRFSGRLVTRQ